MNGWRVDVDPRSSFFVANRSRVLVWRELSGGRSEVVLRDGSLRILDSTAEADHFDVGFVIPTDALDALRDAVDRLAGRRYDETLVAEIRGTLEVERARLDSLVDRLAAAALHEPRS